MILMGGACFWSGSSGFRVEVGWFWGLTGWFFGVEKVVFEWSGVGMGFEWVIFVCKWGLSWCFLGFEWVVFGV